MKQKTSALMFSACMILALYPAPVSASPSSAGWNACNLARNLQASVAGTPIPASIQKKINKAVALCDAWRKLHAATPKTSVVVTGNGLSTGGRMDTAPSGAAYWWRDGAPQYVVFPNPALTPGMVDVEVTQETLGETTCRPGGYTSNNRVTRPSEPVRDVSSSSKDQVFGEYGLVATDGQKYGVDHLVSLQLGGANGPWTLGASTVTGAPGGSVTVSGNLWPVPYYMVIGDKSPGFGAKVFAAGKREKDRTENQLKADVCNGTITLRDAQTSVASNWWGVYVTRCAAKAEPDFKRCNIDNIPVTARMGFA